MKSYAHSIEGKSEEQWQTLEQHLKGTAKLAARFAADFNAERYGYILGLLHDLGKYSKEFQRKLRGKKIHVDHSTAGAQKVKNLFGEHGKILAYSIAGHHSGLLNGGNKEDDSSLEARFFKKIYDYSHYKQDFVSFPSLEIIPLPLKYNFESLGFTIAFFVRMLYSCLVDADFIDTENFYEEQLPKRGEYLSVTDLNKLLNIHLLGFKDAKGRINQKRTEILNNCLNAANKEKGLFSLTVPTGGGKTLSSLAFALHHAQLHGLKRVIYVIPYTSIIEQNAQVFKKALNQENVLEHHSNFNFGENTEENSEAMVKLKHASENWEIPIVATTNVQFFESFFANKSSKSRKLHNIAQSVVIFDEAQMIPLNYLRPCIQTISELVRNYNCSAVLCTATQPAFGQLLPEDMTIEEITNSPKELYQFFKRVKVKKVGIIDDNILSQELLSREKVLCIVNTRKHASKIYEIIKGENSYHLSTLMCPVHRSQTIQKIRYDLENHKTCRVVSTQLIEAGVDLDFKTVYRAAAGIDSIVQAAGRCNRNGNERFGQLYIFNSSEKHGKTPNGLLSRTAKIADMVLNKYEDPISLEAIEEYFRQLYDFEGEQRLDNEDILSLFEEGAKDLNFKFQEAASKFKLIKEDTVSIIIPYDERAQELLEQINYVNYPKILMRKLQTYIVSVYENEYYKLLQENVLEQMGGLFIILKDMNYYDPDTGLKTFSEESYGDAIFA